MTAGSPDDIDALRRRRLRSRNRAILVALLAMVALIYVISIVRMGGG